MKATDPSGLEVAVIGMVGRFPGARDVEQFWANMVSGTESVTRFSQQEMLADGVAPEVFEAADYVPAGGVLADIDMFDANFFGFTPREAELIDPQQRLFLECAWEALEEAGYDPAQYSGAIGVYAGMGVNAYFLQQLHKPGELPDPADVYHLIFGNSKDHLATRACYKLGLTGPGVSVQTACSTALVAVHLASRSLLGGECDLALAGGVSIRVPQRTGYSAQITGVLAPDGHCRPFDAAAQGTVFGSGLGLVALKRLDDAVADGDHIRAVIKATAINNDGSRKVGYAAPGVDAQRRVIQAAHRLAEVNPESIKFVEAHGTGTPLGDPIEVAALTDAFRSGTERREFCVLGSSKGSVGHLDTAAGVAGLIKAVLAVERGIIPGTTNFNTPNEALRLEESPFVVSATTVPFPGEGPRRAGVSSFGMGGTNAHAIVEEWETDTALRAARPWQLLLLSAATASALSTQRHRMANALENDQVDLADVCHTLRVGRHSFPHRLAICCSDRQDAVTTLRDPDRAPIGVATNQPPVAFLFPGQGTQQPGMASGLYRTEPVFCRTIDDCAERFRDITGYDIRDVLLVQDASVDRTVHTQPALFVTEFALATLLQSIGVEPCAMAGHSLGEYVAACLSGALPLEDALRMVATRGRLLEDLPPGAMLSVQLSETEISSLQTEFVSLAAVNGPSNCVLAGSSADIDLVAATLSRQGVSVRRLATNRAFHSVMMEPAMDALSAMASRCNIGAARIPFVSNVTGTWVSDEDLRNGDYWARHLRATVRFADGLAEIARTNPGCVFLEVGPGATLTALARRQRWPAISVLPHGGGDVRGYIEAVGRLWLAGAPVDGNELSNGERRHRVTLPTYPFERRRHWAQRAAVAPASKGHRRFRGKRSDTAEWFTAPVWQEFPVHASASTASGAHRDPASPPDSQSRRWVALLGERRPDHSGRDESRDIGHMLLERVAAVLGGAIEVGAWPAEAHVLNDESVSILYVGGLDRDGTTAAIELAQIGRSLIKATDVVALTSGAFDVTGAEPLRVDRAALVGPCLSIQHEIPGARCRLVDADPDDPFAAALLAAELTSIGDHTDHPIVAHRAGRRWRRTLVPLRLDGVPSLVDRGTYVVIGAGGVGGALAGHFAQHAGARLAIISRNAPGADLIRRLKSRGAEVLPLVADAADAIALSAAFDLVEERFGGIDGVVYAAGSRYRQRLRDVVPSEFAQHIDVRAQNLRNLADAMADRAFDFCGVASSLSSVVGGTGLAGYAGSHAVVDAICREQRRAGRPWVAVDCDNWLGEGMSAATLSGNEPAMTADEGSLAFLRAALLSGLPQIAISTRDTTVPARPETLPLSSTARQSRPEMNTDFVAPRTEAERILAEIWQQRLGIDRVGLHDNFFDLGGDSLTAIEIVNKANQAGLHLSAKHLLDHQTVADLATVAETSPPADCEQGPVTGTATLLPAQRRFLEQETVDTHWFDQSIGLSAQLPLDHVTLERAIKSVVAHHDALRARFSYGPRGWEQTIAPPNGALPLPHVDLTGLSDGEGEVSVRLRGVMDAARAGFDLADGPLFAVIHGSGSGGSPDALVFLAHHLIIDTISWRFVVEDILLAYQQLRTGVAVELPRKSTSIAQWGQYLAAFTADAGVRAETDYWTDESHRLAPLLPYDTDGDDEGNLVGNAETVVAELDTEQTTRICAVVRRANAELSSFILASIVRAIHGWTGTPTLSINVEGHGRQSFDDRVDVSRTVGWFTAAYPVVFDEGGGDLLESARRVAETLQAVPRGGLGHGLLRWSDDTQSVTRLAEVKAPQVSFVYLGELDGLLPAGGVLKIMPEFTDASRSPQAPRRHLIDIAASIQDGRLRIEWRAPRKLESTITRLADDTITRLQMSSDSVVTPNFVHRAWSPIVRLSGGAMRPFFCVHPAGGVAHCYASLARLMPDRPFYGIRGRGLASGEAADTNLEHMAQKYLNAVLVEQPHGPYLLGGWSFGGTVAFEMALRLQNLGEDVALVVLDSPPPIVRNAGLPSEDSLRVTFARGASLIASNLMGPDDLRQPDAGLERAFNVWKAHLEALVTYVPARRFDGSVAILAAEDAMPLAISHTASVDEVALYEGWHSMSTKPPIMRTVPGNHFTLVAAPHVATVAQTLSEVLSRVDPG